MSFTRSNRFLYLFLVLFVSSLPLSTLTKNIAIKMSDFEKSVINANPYVSYVCFDEKLSKITRVISRISDLDDNKNSLLLQLNKHIANGFSWAEYDVVCEVLEYAADVLQSNRKKVSVKKIKEMTTELDKVTEQVFSGELTIKSNNLRFIGITRLSANADNWSLSTGDIERVSISAAGVVSINNLTPAGVVHNGDLGDLSSSLIVDADITDATISNAKLATIASADIPDNIVVRDGAGNFATNMITIDGMVFNPTDVATKEYVDAVLVTGILAKDPALVISVANETLSGLPTIDDVALVANDRVLLIGQTDPVENGLWLAQVDAWIRPIDFDTGDQAGQAYVLVLAGTVNAGSSWLCNTPTAIIDIDPIGFSLFALPDATNAANVGAGTGLVFKDKTGTTLNFRSLLSGAHFNIATNPDDVTISTDATNDNIPTAIVSRDGSGDFSAGMITADLNGNAATATTAIDFSGALSGDVTGTQGATVVSFVGGQTAADIATATILANDATSSDVVNTIVLRDGSGNFATNMITLDGTVTNPTDAATKAYVDSQISIGTNLNTPDTIVRRDETGSFAAQVVSVVDTVSSGNFVLSTNPSTSTAGNILKGSNRFIHNFGITSTFVGVNAGNFTFTGTGNSGFGTNALTALTTGSGNTAFGSGALGADNTGSNNTAVGFNSLAANLTGSGNVAVGISALLSNTGGTQNVAVGQTTLALNTIGGANTAVGFNSMAANTIGGANTAVGQNSLGSTTTGSNNTAVGAHALQSNTTGGSNIGIGFDSLGNLVNGSANVACGINTLENITTGSNNVAIGSNAGVSATLGSSNNIYISNVGVAAESSTIRIGTNGIQTRCFAAGIRGVTTANNNAIAVFVDSVGQLGTISSSAHSKENIEDMNKHSENIYKLRPVTFTYRKDATKAREYGLIAEEVDEVYPELVARDENGEPYSVKYHVLPALLLNEMKKQQSTIHDLRSHVEELKVTNKAMGAAMTILQEKIHEFSKRIKTLENRA